MSTVDVKRIQPLGKKAMHYLANSVARVNLLQGSVRSGKTFVSVIDFVDSVQKSPAKYHLMSGNTLGSVTRNVIEGEFGLLDYAGRKRTRFQTNGNGGAKININFGKGNEKVIYVFGAHHQNSHNPVRGLTIGHWYADEVTLHHQNFVAESLNRMSGDPNGKAIWTTNPDSPFHWVMTEWIMKAKEKNVNIWKFTMEDNTALPKEYVEALRKQHTGAFYQRYILGNWVAAEGRVYDMFQKDVHVVSNENIPETSEYEYVFLCGDYGMSNATFFLCCGMMENGDIYVLDEYMYDGKKRNAVISEITDELFSKFRKYMEKVKYIILDPSAKVMRTQMKKDFPEYEYRNAKNAVLDGIQTVALYLVEENSYPKLRISENCKNLIGEMYEYVWDEKSARNGDEKPKKENDHGMDALRYGIFTFPKMIDFDRENERFLREN